MYVLIVPAARYRGPPISLHHLGVNFAVAESKKWGSVPKEQTGRLTSRRTRFRSFTPGRVFESNLGCPYSDPIGDTLHTLDLPRQLFGQRSHRCIAHFTAEGDLP